MKNIITKSIKWCGDDLVLEAGKVGYLSDGAVMLRYGGTVILATINFKKEVGEFLGFFPLSVHYQERFYSVGRIRGGFNKREGKPAEREMLISRLIDRGIRPLFHEDFKNEVQVVVTVLSYDGGKSPDVLGIIAVSAAIAISGVPFNKTIAGVRIGHKDGKYLINQLYEDESELDLVMIASKDSTIMVESSAAEVSNEVILGALDEGRKACTPVIEFIDKFAKSVGKELIKLDEANDSNLVKAIEKKYTKDIRKAYSITDKKKRTVACADVKKRVLEEFANDDVKEGLVLEVLKKVTKEIVRDTVLTTKERIDGRDNKAIRDIKCEIDLLPYTHGSALFNRGETQAIAITTLGAGDDAQIVDDIISSDGRERFMLHYNFQGYSVGEVARMVGPGRREIGHGRLASKAIEKVLPNEEKFPYVVRVVSEITSCNGSSSMATICASSLSLMAAGVPIERPVAGIAMGMIKKDDKYQILSDIIADEDHIGDMDFKVAATKQGITALQMDLKIEGVTRDLVKEVLTQAREGIDYILSQMTLALKGPRSEVRENAPRMTEIKISSSKIKDVIGPGGKVVKEICEKAKAKLDIQDDGRIKILAASQEDMLVAQDMIMSIVSDPELGKVYEKVAVSSVTRFGCFVKYAGNNEGLIHKTELKNELKEGDTVDVKVLKVERGKVFFTTNLEKSVDAGKRNESSDRKRNVDRKPNKRHFNNAKYEKKSNDGESDKRKKRFW